MSCIIVSIIIIIIIIAGRAMGQRRQAAAGRRESSSGGTTCLTLLPVEVRCYISCFRRLARSARCNTMSHLTADASFSYTSRAKCLM